MKTKLLLFALGVLGAVSLRADPGNVLSWGMTGPFQASFTCQYAVVRIDLLDSHVARVRAVAPATSFAPDESFAVVRSWPGAAFTTSGASPIVFQTSGFQLDVHTTPFRMVFRRPDQSVYLTDLGSSGLETMHASGWKWARFTQNPEDQAYGLGMILSDQFSYRGRQRMQFNARAGYLGGAMTDMAVPLMVSSRGYGLYLDSSFVQRWDFSLSGSSQWQAEVYQDEIDYYFIAGDGPASVLDRYTQMTGRSPIPPRWTFGFIQSRYGYKNWGEVWAERNSFRAHDLPLDGLVLDLYWFGAANQMGALDWDLTEFPDPAANIAALGADGIRVLAIHEPYINRDNSPARENFLEASAAGYLVFDDAALTTPSIMNSPGFFESAGYVDFVNPAARAWLFGKIRHLVDEGIAAHWTDLGEPETDDLSDYVFGGRRQAEVHNVYNLLWHQALAEGYGLHYPDQRLFLLSRSGFAGDQRFGASHWTNDTFADWPVLRGHLSALAHYGFSGMSYFGSDIGGFYGLPSNELYLRWFQFGAFNPTFRAHGLDNKPIAPHEFSSQVEDYCRNQLRLRYRLLPYIYDAARETFENGMPMCRPMPMAYPSDVFMTNDASQFLFGPALLVAPVMTQGAVTRSVYLPAGRWIEGLTGNVVEGPATLASAPAPLSDIPLYWKDDSIVPLGPILPSSDWDDGTERGLRIACREFAETTLYEDDGISNQYLTNRFVTTHASAWRSNTVVGVRIGGAVGEYDGMPLQRAWGIELFNTSAVLAVEADGVTLQRTSGMADLRALPSGFYADGAEKLLHIRLPAAGIRQAREVRIFLDPDAPPPFEVRMSGGGRVHLDQFGQRWEADRVYSAGSYGFDGSGFKNRIEQPIVGTEDDVLYFTERGNTAFDARFDCPNGTYRVDVLNAETVWSTTGQRIFDVSVEGNVVHDNYDIVAAAGGGNRAVTASSTNTVTDGQLTVSFQFVSSPNPSEVNARCAAIRICKIGEPDSDGDGIPDWWMNRTFGHPTGQVGDLSRAGDDADEDGLTTREEYWARTHPKFATSSLRFTGSERVGDSTVLSWSSVPGIRYAVFRRTVDGQAAGSVLSPTHAAQSTMSVEDEEENEDLGLFYRLEAVPWTY